jgi:hypothetical protein
MQVRRMARQALFVTTATAVMATVAGLSAGTASATSLTANSPAGASAVTRPANCEGQSDFFVLDHTSASGVYWYRGNLGDWYVTNLYMGRSFNRICI